MKKTLLLLFSLLALSLIAQQEAPPQGINYQAVVYSDNGNNQPGLNSPGQVLWNEDIGVQFSILSGSATGTVIYKETHATSTDEFGMFDLVIGQGLVQGTQSFNMIEWGSGYHFLKVEVDKTGGTDYVEMSNQQLWSVPYALYSGYSSSSGYADSSAYSDIAGNGLTGVSDNGDGTLTFTYYDGSTYTTTVLSGLGGVGPQGPAGADGQDGQDGLSAYEIWLSQGNTGTEADFLNGLTGPQGPAGTNGQSGFALDPFTAIPDSIIILNSNSTFEVPIGFYARITCPMHQASYLDFFNSVSILKINGSSIYVSEGHFYQSEVTSANTVQQDQTEKYFLLGNALFAPEGTTIEILDGLQFLNIQLFANQTNFTIKLIDDFQIVPVEKKWRVISFLVDSPFNSINEYKFKLNSFDVLAGFGNVCPGNNCRDRQARKYISGDLWLPEGTSIEPSTGLFGFVVIEY